MNEKQKIEELQKIEQTIHNMIGWAINKDFELSFSTLTHDEDFIEVHPTDTVVKGFEAFKKNSEFFKDPRFKAVRHEIRDLRIGLSQTGTVAWFYCILDDLNEWEGKPLNWENTRWTGVLEKQDGNWIFVQQHFSFASGD